MILNPTAIKTISDLRANPLAVLKVAEDLEEPVYIFHRSTPKGVILSIEDLNNLMDEIEDLKDAIEVAKRHKSAKRKLIPWKKVKKDLNLS